MQRATADGAALCKDISANGGRGVDYPVRMDISVQRAIEQWPNVPDVYGWLSLDRKGRWLLRGEAIANPKVSAFIGRNYLRQDDGGYAFQNGPQKVHVALETTPWVAQVSAEEPLALQDHTGQPITEVSSVWLTDTGQVVLAMERGAAMLQDQDLVLLLPHLRIGGAVADEDQLLAALEDPAGAQVALCWQGQLLPLQTVADAALPQQLGFVRKPVAARSG